MRARIGVAALAVLATAGCGDDTTGSVTAGTSTGESQETPDSSATSVTTEVILSGRDVIDPADGGHYQVEIDPAVFSSRVDHPFLPKLPGTVWMYEARSGDGEVEIITVEVLDETRMVMGVETIVVHDIVHTEDGRLVEDTFDWFAQDTGGNVWYFGEDTKAYDEDGNVSEAGAWEAGVDGALPGIVMQAEPAVADTGYRQEFYAGEAEDMGQVIDRGVGVVITRDWTPLEADVVEEKTYVEGVGFVYEWKVDGEGATESVHLIDFTRSSAG